MSHEEVIRAALEPYIRAAGRREEAASKIYAAIEDTGTMLDSVASTVEVPDSRVPFHAIQRWGLTIWLDGAGNAVRVHHPLGLEVIEYVPADR